MFRALGFPLLPVNQKWSALNQLSHLCWVWMGSLYLNSVSPQDKPNQLRLAFIRLVEQLAKTNL
jgi:hypothetical protein